MNDIVMPYGIDSDSDAGYALSELYEVAERHGYRVERFQTNSKRNSHVLEGLHWVVTPNGDHRYFDNPHDPKHSAINDRIASFTLASLEYKCPRIFAAKLWRMLAVING
jgi:hypothetical protein